MRVAWIAVLLLSGCVRAYGPPSTTPRADACRARLLPAALLPVASGDAVLRPARDLQRVGMVLAATHTCDEMAALERQLVRERRARLAARESAPRRERVAPAPTPDAVRPPPNPFDLPDNPY